MKKNIIIILVLLLIPMGAYIFNEKDVPQYDEVSIGDKVTIENEDYEVTFKQINKFVYDGDLLIETLSPDNALSTRQKYFYDGELLVKEERYRDEKLTLVLENKYEAGNLVETKKMDGSRVIGMNNIVWEDNKRIASITDSEGIVRTSTIVQDENGNNISNEVVDANGEVGFTYTRKYKDDLLIESDETYRDGYTSHNVYEYNKLGDLAIQRVVEVDEKESHSIVYFEYDYNDDKKPVEKKYFILKSIDEGENVES